MTGPLALIEALAIKGLKRVPLSRLIKDCTTPSGLTTRKSMYNGLLKTLHEQGYSYVDLSRKPVLALEFLACDNNPVMILGRMNAYSCVYRTKRKFTVCKGNIKETITWAALTKILEKSHDLEVYIL